MADAHPDRSGINEEYLARRERYNAAVRAREALKRPA
jgi:hypothetical protein